MNSELLPFVEHYSRESQPWLHISVTQEHDVEATQNSTFLGFLMCHQV